MKRGALQLDGAAMGRLASPIETGEALLYLVRRGDRDFEVAVRALPEGASHTRPPEPGRRPEPGEAAEVIARLFVAALVGEEVGR